MAKSISETQAMKDPIRTEHLGNGLTVEFYDHSNRYFGDYHRVRVEARCRYALNAGNFADGGQLQRVRNVLGDELVFTRYLEQMGVAGARVEETRQDLVDSFVRNSFPYLANPAFSSRLVIREMERRKRGRRSFGIV